jgi:hypothetical protein
MSNFLNYLVAAVQFTTAAKIWAYKSSELLTQVGKVCAEGGLVVEFDAFQRAHSQVTSDVLELMGIRHLADIPPTEEKLINDSLAFNTALDGLFEKARHKAGATSIFRFQERRKAWVISELLERAFAHMKPNLLEILNLSASRRLALQALVPTSRALQQTNRQQE